MADIYLNPGPTREEVNISTGPLVLEFGTSWCGHCKSAQPLADEALSKYPEILHLQIEDGSGRSLGRSFGVKLWPTFIFIKDGKEISRVVRPVISDEILMGLQLIV
jgi:thioredoxin 1